MKKTGTALAVVLLLLSALSASAGRKYDNIRIHKYIGSLAVDWPDCSTRDMNYWFAGVQTNGRTGYIKSARQCFSCGVAQADFRICTYEDGSPIVENGKLFFCSSSREAGCGVTVYSHDINTSTFTLTGCFVRHRNSGESSSTLSAPHLMFNRTDSLWYVYAHSLGDLHYLSVGKTGTDLRYGFNEVETDILDYEDKILGDEDDFVFYDSQIGKWVLVYSRKSTTIAKQTSDFPDHGYRMEAVTEGFRSLTGINVVWMGEEKFIVCGSGNSADADAYKVFGYDDLKYLGNLALDIPTGGFRGWGTVFSVNDYACRKYQLLTFDRACPNGNHRWEYGNIYLFEAPVNALAQDPTDLRFHRKFTKRLNLSQEIPTGGIDLGCEIFLPNGTPYPVRDSSASYIQTEEGVRVTGKGKVSLLGGTHLTGSEYVIDLDGIRNRETRFLAIGSMESDAITVAFRRRGSFIVIKTCGDDTLEVPLRVRKIRIVTSSVSFAFYDATE